MVFIWSAVSINLNICVVNVHMTIGVLILNAAI